MPQMSFGPEMSDSNLSRRDFLKFVRTALLTVSALFGLDILMRFLSHPTQPPVKTEYDLGLVTDYLPDSRTDLPDIPAILIRTDQGFTALSLVCTHLGCTVEAGLNGFTCPCHGSRFDLQGKVEHGPAASPLKSLRLEITPDGKLML